MIGKQLGYSPSDCIGRGKFNSTAVFRGKNGNLDVAVKQIHKDLIKINYDVFFKPGRHPNIIQYSKVKEGHLGFM